MFDNTQDNLNTNQEELNQNDNEGSFEVEKKENDNNEQASNDLKNTQEQQIDDTSIHSRKKGLFERLLHRKVSDTTPTITKGKKNEYVHKTFVRKKDEEPDPETFPKKKKIMSWQEEAMIMADGLEVDLELAEEMAELAERKD